MAEILAQKARRVLVSVVSSYDASVVRKTAVENSSEFRAFLDKELMSGELDFEDILDITNEVEDNLGISFPSEVIATWQEYFTKINQLLNEG